MMFSIYSVAIFANGFGIEEKYAEQLSRKYHKNLAILFWKSTNYHKVVRGVN